MNEFAQQHMDADTARAARPFVSSVAGLSPVRTAILFGSRARDSFLPESDADSAAAQEEWNHLETLSNPRLIETIWRKGFPLPLPSNGR